MKMPKYISEALRLRTKYAELLIDKCCIVDDFIQENGLDSLIETYDWATGVEIYINPRDSEQRIREAIERFGEGDD